MQRTLAGPVKIHAVLGFAATLACGLTLRAALADTRFDGPGAVPLADDVRSVLILRQGESIFTAPSSASSKRGAAARGVHLPVFGARRGPGCSGRWFLVAPHAFVCEDGAEPSPDAPVRYDEPPAPTAEGLPYRYYFVNPDGTFGYRWLDSAEEGVPDAQFLPGFGLAVEREGRKREGDPFGFTTRGYWVPMRDLVPAAPVNFEGNAFSEDLAWIISERAPVFRDPRSPSRLHALERLSAIKILETREFEGVSYLRVAEDAWVRSRDTVRPERTAPPAEVQANERWIDVDLKRQIAVAYEGSEPWFATLVSTGRGRPGSEMATLEGTFRLWVKLRSTDMGNLQDLEAREAYAIEAVPWAMFFKRGYGLHGTFWHQRFGAVRSHGCVNLAPRDAERLFSWTSPRLLPGWTAAFPYAHEPGTLVRVRRGG